uniref:Uncharacterized protein n=1 Tax=Oryza nivara TaxID=4536 RepID=A0A0E0HJA0_ORYNI
MGGRAMAFAAPNKLDLGAGALPKCPECESDPTRTESSETQAGRPLLSPLLSPRLSSLLLLLLSFPPPLPPATPAPLHRPPPRPPPPPTHPFASLPSPLDRTSTPLRPCPVFSPANPNPSSARQSSCGEILLVVEHTLKNPEE